LSEAEDRALFVCFDHPNHARHRLRAPTAPGHLATIGVTSYRALELDESVSLPGPTILAFDGERKRRILDGDHATLVVRRDGPRVIDVRAVMVQAARSGRLLSTAPVRY
jgi:hypothetical protein